MTTLRPALLLGPVLALFSLGPATAEVADWTLLIYSVGDNDLEWYNVQEAEQCAEATPSDRVNVVFLFDRDEADDEDAGYTAEPLGSLGGFTGAKRFAVRGGKFTDVEDAGEPNMGDPRTFVEFMAWGVKAYPAKRYAVIFSDHGMGYGGFGGDDSHEEDGFTLEEIGAALEQGCEESGIGRIDLLFWDCCSMAEIEVAVTCQPYARVMLASEATMPGAGTDPGKWLTALAEDPEMDAKRLAEAICEAYARYYDGDGTQRALTLAAIDLDRVPAIVEACDALARRLVGELSEGGDAAWTDLAEAARSAETVEFTDLRELAERLEGTGGGEEATRLAQAVADAVTHSYEGADYDGTGGLSVYFPSSPDWEDEAYPEACLSQTWDAAIAAGLAVANGDDVPPEVAECAASDVDLAEGEEAHVTANVDPRGIAECYFVLAVERDAKRIAIGRYPVEPSAGSLDEQFDGTWLSLGDAQHQILAPIDRYEETDEKNDVYVVTVPVEYQGPHGGAWQELTLRYEIDWNDDAYQGTFLYATKHTQRGDAQFTMRAGAKVRPVYFLADGKGREERVVLPDAPELVVGEKGLSLVGRDLEAGRYLVGFRVEDYAGNATESLLPIDVK